MNFLQVTKFWVDENLKPTKILGQPKFRTISKIYLKRK